MRISDWRSDVCSSDLAKGPTLVAAFFDQPQRRGGRRRIRPCTFLFPTPAEDKRYKTKAEEQIGAHGDLCKRGYEAVNAEGRGPLRRRQEWIAGSREHHSGCSTRAAFIPSAFKRSEERRVGKEGVSTCRSRGTP